MGTITDSVFTRVVCLLVLICSSAYLIMQIEAYRVKNQTFYYYTCTLEANTHQSNPEYYAFGNLTTVTTCFYDRLDPKTRFIGDAPIINWWWLAPIVLVIGGALLLYTRDEDD